jgi:hypothetical protein
MEGEGGGRAKSCRHTLGFIYVGFVAGTQIAILQASSSNFQSSALRLRRGMVFFLGAASSGIGDR